MGTPVEIADAVVRDADRFGLVLAAAQHARQIGRDVVGWNAAPVGTRSAAALSEVALDPALRQDAWRRLIDMQRVEGEVDDASDIGLPDEDGLVRLFAEERARDDLAA